MKTRIIILAAVICAILSASAAKADLSIVKSKFDVTLYGYVKAESIYHDHRAFSEDFIIFALPDMMPFRHQPTLSFTARQTRVGLNVSAPGPTENSKVLGNVEFDFYDSGSRENKYGFHLRRATATLKFPWFNIMAGNEWMLISPLYPHTSNYPAGAGMGNLGYRMPQMRVTVGDKWRAAASIGRKIESDLTTSSFDSGAVSTMPDCQVQLGYWGKKGLIVALSGHFAKEKTVEGPNASNHYIDHWWPSWSYNFSVNIPITKWLAFSGEAYYGSNLDGWYTGGIWAQGVGYNWNLDRVAIHDWGGWAEIMVKPMKKLTIYTGYGEDNPFARDMSNGIFLSNKSEMAGFQGIFGGNTAFGQVTMTKNRMIYAHIMYDITDAFKVGFEVMNVHTWYQNPKLDVNNASPVSKKTFTPPTIRANHGDVMSYDVAFWFYF